MGGGARLSFTPYERMRRMAALYKTIAYEKSLCIHLRPLGRASYLSQSATNMREEERIRSQNCRSSPLGGVGVGSWIGQRDVSGVGARLDGSGSTSSRFTLLGCKG